MFQMYVGFSKLYSGPAMEEEELEAEFMYNSFEEFKC